MVRIPARIFLSLSAAGFAHASLDIKTIHFPEGKPLTAQTASDIDTVLDVEERRTLEAIRDALQQSPSLGVEVSGYADKNECSISECYTLSLRRARIILDWLSTHGVPEAQLKGPVGESVDFPLYEGATAEERSFNRRVHFEAYTVEESEAR